jgi:hypothetical protein
MRTLFAIHAGKAHLAEALPDSVTHMSWMIDQGVIKSQTDAAYEDVVRGQLVAGFLTLYRGSRFSAPDKTVEPISRLRQISAKLGVDKTRPVRVAQYGGPVGKNLGSTSRRLNYALWKIWSDEEAEPRPAS